MCLSARREPIQNEVDSSVRFLCQEYLPVFYLSDRVALNEDNSPLTWGR